MLENVGKLAFLTKILPKVFKGTHVDQPSVHVFPRRRVEIRCDRPFTMYADGDPIGELPVRVSTVGGAVSVLVPDDVSAGKLRLLPLPSSSSGDPVGLTTAAERRRGRDSRRA